MAWSDKTGPWVLRDGRLITIMVILSMVSFAQQEQKFINIVLTPRDWQDPTQADGFFCGTDKNIDAERLLAEFNTNFIFRLIDKTQDITPRYRTTVVDFMAFDKNEQPNYMLDQPSCTLEKVEPGLFTVFLAPATRQCNKLTFEDASKDKDGYHPLAVLASSDFTDIKEWIISNANTFTELYGGIMPKACVTQAKMSNETAHSRKNELTGVFNFPFNEDRNIDTDIRKMCKTVDDTLCSITESSLFEVNADMSFKYDQHNTYEEDGHAKIEILRTTSTNKRALGFVTTDFPGSGGQCNPASDDDIVPLNNLVVFNGCEEETEVIVRVKTDAEIEEAECFYVHIRKVTEMQSHKRVKRMKKGKNTNYNEHFQQTAAKTIVQINPISKINIATLLRLRCKVDFKNDMFFLLCMELHDMGKKGLTVSNKDDRDQLEEFLSMIRNNENFKAESYMNNYKAGTLMQEMKNRRVKKTTTKVSHRIDNQQDVKPEEMKSNLQYQIDKNTHSLCVINYIQAKSTEKELPEQSYKDTFLGDHFEDEDVKAMVQDGLRLGVQNKENQKLHGSNLIWRVIKLKMNKIFKPEHLDKVVDMVKLKKPAKLEEYMKNGQLDLKQQIDTQLMLTYADDILEHEFAEIYEGGKMKIMISTFKHKKQEITLI